jgi:hypothetical protein
MHGYYVTNEKKLAEISRLCGLNTIHFRLPLFDVAYNLPDWGFNFDLQGTAFEACTTVPSAATFEVSLHPNYFLQIELKNIMT